jgi:hypothetical protein
MKGKAKASLMEAELLRLMGVRQQAHESVPGPIVCRWCETVVKLATGEPFLGEAHDPECFAGKTLGRPVRGKPS